MGQAIGSKRTSMRIKLPESIPFEPTTHRVPVLPNPDARARHAGQPFSLMRPPLAN